jgi:hypothetical protein
MLQWLLLLIGITGFASVFWAAWQDTADPAWRAAHGLRVQRAPLTKPLHRT